ncbi:DUF1365 family protein [Paenibacillus psychroresistens]|uniref:DUF1365 family protein n=1 Tax=Paenibacillus psychroresistens TaxID=1778678 RepID=A0A6B8RSU9_9BACL|nr:DUF1365 family protein [Paenibacillus psychroresistens]QGQ98533.1 DUF1365 family protein [Paenibacillus psychroresistens]
MSHSRIYQGEVWHARFNPVGHSFQYPVYFFSFRLSELEGLSKQVRFFSYNRCNLVSLYDRDYLSGSGSIEQKLRRILTEKGLNAEVEEIDLVTTARYFHYVFNPVSFYYCYRADQSLSCIVAEVNNTFGERHVYVLDSAKSLQDESNSYIYEEAKAFHVSPFNDMAGYYKFYFSDITEEIKIKVDLYKEGKRVFATMMKGAALPFQSSSLLSTIMRYPLSTALTMPRIVWQAAKIHWKKGLPIYMKPQPSSAMTVQVAKPSIRIRICQRLVFRFFSNLQVGCLIIHLPNREQHVFGDSSSTLKVNFYVRDYRVFLRLAKDADIGLGEAYTDGFWDCDHLTKLIEIFVENRPYINDNNLIFASLGRLFNRVGHIFNRNSLSGSRKNISFHYDLSNSFYRTFLDPTMTYSCALYNQPEDSLEQAQRNKLNAMIEKAQIKASDHVLEIGSGWGAFSIEAVRQTGCRVTTITLSDQQYELATRRVLDAGLQDRISVELCDYRKMTGQFDKIVSIEMFEAVGHQYYGTFFQTCDRLLKPNGLVAMQVITIADQNYEMYRKSVDWIQKHIFPGGTVPSLTAMTAAMTKHSTFMIEKLDNMGIHYARTLRDWREAFTKNQADIQQLGFDEAFQRSWEYYLCYCEAGFNKRVLGTLQFVLTRTNNSNLPQMV